MNSLKPDALLTIKRSRENKGLSPESVAKAIGLNNPSYYDLESYPSEIECNLLLKELVKLLKTLSLDIGSVISNVSKGQHIDSFSQLNLICAQILKGRNFKSEDLERVIGYRIFQKDGRLSDMGLWNVDCFLRFCDQLNLNVKSVFELIQST